MMASIIDGKAIALSIKEDLKEKVADFKEKYKKDVTLAVILAGNDPASEVYVRNKIKACEFVGIKSLSYVFQESVTQTELENTVKILASDEKVDGILVQLPLPKGLNADKILSLIPPEKDADGFTAENVGNLLLGKDCTVSCTPLGVLTLIKSCGVDLTGKNAVIIGRSNIVGKPTAALLLKENCTVTVCHSKTVNLKEITKTADILVAAIGRPNFVTADMVKDGAIVIDVGINRTDSGLKGDVDFENVSKKAAFITPVPGGVGPMTIAMLLSNTINAALKKVKNV